MDYMKIRQHSEHTLLQMLISEVIWKLEVGLP